MDDEAQDIKVPQPADADGAHVNQDQPVVQAPPDAPALTAEEKLEVNHSSFHYCNILYLFSFTMGLAYNL